MKAFETLKQMIAERYPEFEVEVTPCKDSERLFAVSLYKKAIPPMLIGDGSGFLWAWDKTRPGDNIHALCVLIEDKIKGERCCETCKRPL